MNLFELSAKISADTKDYEKAVKNATKVSKSLKDIMERSAAQSETNKNKIKVLAGEYSSAKVKVAVLTEAFNKAAKEEGVTAEKTQKLAKELQEAEKESSDLKGQLDELTKKSKNAGDGFSKLGSALGKGLKTAGKIGVAAVGVAAAGITALTTAAVNNYAEYEQLVGGAAKIFDEMDNSRIINDAANAYKNLGLSANQYLAVINDVGATFAATMGDEAGYEAATKGLQAISNYASGTGKNVDELSSKFTLITRSTASYQSIADQFSGVLPATSAGFLEQAQAAGILSDSYNQLTEVPIAEYQMAVSEMLTKGVDMLGLAGNTAAEATTTIAGSMAAAKAAFTNFTIGLADENANTEELLNQLVESVVIAGKNIIPKVGDILNNIIKFIGEQGPVLLSNALNYFNNFLTGLTDKAPEIVDFVIDFFKQLVNIVIEQGPDILFAISNFLAQILQAFVDKGLEAGKNLIDNIKQGISDAWQGIVSWFNNLWDGLFGNRSVNVSAGGVNGSHANGLDYVPFDGYIAELHKGERVLTASEAKNYGNGATSIGNININIDGAKYSDEQSLAAAVAQEIQNMADRRSAVYA